MIVSMNKIYQNSFRNEILFLLLKKKKRKIVKLSKSRRERVVVTARKYSLSAQQFSLKNPCEKHIFNHDRTHCRKRDIVADKSALRIVTQKLFACLRIHIFGLSIRSKINFIRSSQVGTSRCLNCCLFALGDTREIKLPR